MNIRQAIKAAKYGKKVSHPNRTNYHHKNVVFVYNKQNGYECLVDEESRNYIVDEFTKSADLLDNWEVIE